ncbi:DUF397 domain-containing protein [Streptomyces axinellae]|uniref:DUF397 domain-containing protein n=1 Tax=Streptomyces axinellae TaxID=552788 RepID=A0ABP6CNI7_9ACTN
MARTEANPTDPTWRKSSYSDGGAGNCVEVADGLNDTIPVRDSKRPDGDILHFPHAAWASFLTHQTAA